MIEPDWIYGLAGGLIIGCAAAFYLLVSGRIMGASGILGGLIDGTGKDTRLERGVFIIGLITAPLLYGLVFGFPATNLTSDPVVLIVAGLCVGFGTRMANGCTSGHGVCGISRFSVRGIVATIAFLTAGFVAMLVFRHMLGWV